MASIRNGQRSGEDREVKRKCTEDSKMIPDKENKGSPGPCHSRHNSLLPVLEDLTNKFQCQIPHQGIVQPSVGHLFTEFYISTMPDTEDFEHDEEILDRQLGRQENTEDIEYFQRGSWRSSTRKTLFEVVLI